MLAILNTVREARVRYSASTQVFASRPSTIRQANELPDDAPRARVIRGAADSAGIAGAVISRGASESSHAAEGSLSDLLDRAQPGTRFELILAVASWLEATTAGGDWTSQALNDQLKQLGQGVPNITDALTTLMRKKPALVRQTRKAGRSQQARKRYLLTVAGRAVVSGLVRGSGVSNT